MSDSYKKVSGQSSRHREWREVEITQTTTSKMTLTITELKRKLNSINAEITRLTTEKAKLESTMSEMGKALDA